MNYSIPWWLRNFALALLDFSDRAGLYLSRIKCENKRIGQSRVRKGGVI